MKVRVIGRGRAGRSFESALGQVGVEVEVLPGRSSRPVLAAAGRGVEAVLVAVPDRFVATVAKAVAPDLGTVVVHCSGSLGLEVLEPHPRRASLHPLATLPDPVIGALRLRGGAFFAVSGDQVATDIALALGGQPIVVAPENRVRYHATAAVAANHLVALLGQVERMAAAAGLPLEAFLPLARGALDDVAMLGPAAALTGPAARHDLETIDAHRRSIDPEERAGYDAGVVLAERLACGSNTDGAAEVSAAETLWS
jgi:predicted short-subunit dehydrogenase-like oxidoreductase (DUF2520 family)